MLTVSESHDPIHCIKDNRMVDHTVVVKLAQIFDLGEPALVEFEIILLQAKRNAFENVVDDGDNETWMIPVESAGNDSKKVYIAILDFAWP